MEAAKPQVQQKYGCRRENVKMNTVDQSSKSTFITRMEEDRESIRKAGFETLLSKEPVNRSVTFKKLPTLDKTLPKIKVVSNKN